MSPTMALNASASTRGIGFAVAAELASRGASVVLVDLKADTLASAAKTLQQRVPGKGP